MLERQGAIHRDRLPPPTQERRAARPPGVLLVEVGDDLLEPSHTLGAEVLLACEMVRPGHTATMDGRFCPVGGFRLPDPPYDPEQDPIRIWLDHEAGIGWRAVLLDSEQIGSGPTRAAALADLASRVTPQVERFGSGWRPGGVPMLSERRIKSQIRRRRRDPEDVRPALEDWTVGRLVRLAEGG